MSYFLPSIFLCISSLFFYFKLKINFSTSVLLSCLITTFFLFTLGKLGLLKEGFIVFKILIILSLFFIISNIYKKKQYKKLSKVLYFFFLYFLLFLFCENLALYKYDEFSEYGITSRLLFSENNIGINIDYLNKGTNFKPNLISVFHYFFLSFEHRFFNEKLAYIAHNFLSFSIIIYLISKKNYNLKNNIIIFFIIYFLSYTLSSGYDRLYVDNLISLFIALIFIIVFQKDIKNVDKVILALSIIFLPLIKMNGVLILFGILPILLFYCYAQKEKNTLIVIIISFILSLLTIEFHTNFKYKFDYSKKKVPSQEGIYSDLVTIDQTVSFMNKETYSQIAKTIVSNRSLHSAVLNKHLELSFEDGIYHAKTFKIINKLLEKLNINFNFKEIPLTIYIWLSLILLLSIFISYYRSEIKIISLLYIGFILSYFLFLVYWGIVQRQINEDLSLEISWQRHIGSLILGYLIFLFTLIKFKSNTLDKYLLILLFISISLSFPRSLKNFMPAQILESEKSIVKNKKLRNEVIQISNMIKKEVPDYQNIIYIVDTDNKYLFSILNYELIKNNIIFYNEYKNKDKFKKNTNFIFTNQKLENIKFTSKILIENNLGNFKLLKLKN